MIRAKMVVIRDDIGKKRETGPDAPSGSHVKVLASG
jgi:hypothetical protein